MYSSISLTSSALLRVVGTGATSSATSVEAVGGGANALINSFAAAILFIYFSEHLNKHIN